MLRFVKNTRQRYEIDLGEKRKQKKKENAVKKVAEEKEDDRRHVELKNIKLSLLQVKTVSTLLKKVS